ncbi:MAG: zinc metallopeptidase [Planctomycetaceae bacterium]
MSPLLLFLMIGLPLASQAVASILRQRFTRYAQDPMPMTGAETAWRMLQEHGITDVQIVPARGHLTDHYDPTKKTIALSEVVYGHANVSSCAVAAHECGHAVQDATGYPLLGMRSMMVPLLKISNLALPIISIGGAGLMANEGRNTLAYVLLGLLAMPTAFSLITLPVEFDASRRAVRWMESSPATRDSELSGARNALWWAAMTYVVAALGSIAQVLVYARMLLGRRR